jgi:hypothetical protein
MFEQSCAGANAIVAHELTRLLTRRTNAQMIDYDLTSVYDFEASSQNTEKKVWLLTRAKRRASSKHRIKPTDSIDNRAPNRHIGSDAPVLAKGRETSTPFAHSWLKTLREAEEPQLGRDSDSAADNSRIWINGEDQCELLHPIRRHATIVISKRDYFTSTHV